MSGVNRVILIGNLGADPEVRSFQNGGKVVNFRLATSENWKDKATGQRKERTEWHSVAVFDENLGRIAEQYLRKGTTVYIEGQLETRKWQDQSGQDRYSTEVVLRPFRGVMTMIGSRLEAQEQVDPRPDGQSSQPRDTRSPQPRDDFDDDIPF